MAAPTYPTASYAPAMEKVTGGAPTTVVETVETAAAAPTAVSSVTPPSTYIQPTTYAPPMYVSESGPYATGSYAMPSHLHAAGPPSYTPAPASYVAGGSYQ